MLEHLELSGLGLVELLLELVDVRRGALKLDLKFLLGLLHTVVMSLPGISLSLYVGLGVKTRVQLKNCGRKFDNDLVLPAHLHQLLVDLRLVGHPLSLHLGGEALLVCGHLVDVYLLTLCHLSFEILNLGL